MRIAVCDDEEIFRADIQKHIDKLYSSLDVVVDSFSGGKDLIAAFESRPYDLVFLDLLHNIHLHLSNLLKILLYFHKSSSMHLLAISLILLL